MMSFNYNKKKETGVKRITIRYLSLDEVSQYNLDLFLIIAMI